MPIKRKVAEIQEKTPTLPTRPKLHKVNDVLSTIFYLVWIIIGAFVIFIIVGEVRGGALQSMLGGGPSSNVQGASNTQPPTETDIPGIGRVNIECVKNALSTASIQKMLEAGNTSTLTSDEKAKFDPCVVGPSETSPSPSASPKK